MSISAIDSVVTQLQMTASAARQQPTEVPSGESFSGHLSAALTRISDTQNAAKAQAENFALGKPGVALNDVMTDLQKATISLQMGIQTRNKLVAAYQEIMGMQI